MKLTILHETTLVGTVAIKPNALGVSKTSRIGPDMFKPRGEPRWYLAFSDDDYIEDLMENSDGGAKKIKTQFGSQTSKPKKLVWQPEESQGRELTNKSLYVPPGTMKAKPYKWPRTTFHGQSEGYDEHIIK